MAAQRPEELLFESERTRVVRLQRLDGTGSVVSKEPRGPGAAQRLHHEATILERLAGIEGLPRLASGQPNRSALAFEDTGGTALSDIGHVFETGPLLELAWRLAGILAEVHRRGVVHKDINPANIVVSGPETTPLLIDFGLASTFAEERPAFTHESEIVGTLAYLAPEQTGRTGRSVDQRADLYALGATLYALATGRPPFGNGDPLELIHDHLALTPAPAYELNAALPHGLSNVILRLLEKEPDARYQSAEGLAHDLFRLRAQYARGETALFALGERDFPSRLSAPSRLVGRDVELSALRTGFESALRGQQRGVLVAGAPGVGKTALINELRPIVTAVGGWFVIGKCDQYRADAASGAVVQALRALGRMLLAEPSQLLAAQRPRILHALGANAGVFIALVPEFGLLLGLQPPEVAEVDPLNATARLTQTSLLVLREIASPVRPVVLVLDDLQWASAAAIDLVDAVLMDQALSGLLLVGAYREAEVDSAHPLSGMMSRWTRLGLAPPLLRLRNLPAADVSALLAQMLRLPPGEAASLAGAVGARTGGNPFDTVELVNALRRDGALVLGEAGWRWDATTIRRHVGQGEVLEILATRIEQLPPSARALLEAVACLGGEVELGLLRAATGLSAAALEEQLTPPLEDGLLMIEHSGEPAVRFRHDRVQQAALGRMQPEARQHLHLQLARRLADERGVEAVAAEQYLAAVEAVHLAPERRRVAGLFREVAASMRLTNGPVAEQFLAAAIGLLNAVGRLADAPFHLALQIERHAALFSLGRLDEADDLYGMIERSCPNPLDLAPSARVQLSTLTSRSRQREAGELGLNLLRRLGLDVPQPGEFGPRVAQRLGTFYAWVESLPDPDEERVFELETDDARVRAAANLITRLLSPGLFSDLLIRAWLTLESQRLWTDGGLCPAMVANLGSAISVTIGLRQDYFTGYIAARHGVSVGEVHAYEPETSIARFVFATTAQHWFEPLENCVAQLQLAREGLIRGGDLRIACFAYNETIVGILDSGATLDAYATEVAAGLTFAARTGNEQFTGSFLAHRQLLKALRGETEAPGSFTDSSFDEEAHLASLANSVAALSFHVQRALGAALFGDAAILVRHAAAASTLLPVVAGRYLVVLTYLLQALALAGRVRAAIAEERAGLLAELDVCREWLALRAADAPSNFLHLLNLVDAERAWATDDFRGAVFGFEAAHRAVNGRNRPWHAALIVERAAFFHLEHGLEHAGQRLLAEARARYEAWGASGKVRQLDQAFAFLQAADRPQRSSGTTRISPDSIDLVAVLRASQALSAETNLVQLHARVVEVLSAMTGATGVRVLFWNDDAQVWFLPSTVEGKEAPMSVDEAGGLGLLPLSAFRYAERTREPLLVEDATRDDRFARDPYLAGINHCSLLVVPVLARAAPRAMLVLENRLIRSAFSADRLDAAMLIAGQLAVSLDNALAERFRSLVQRSSDVTLVCDRAGVVSYASAASAEMLGIEDGALTGRDVCDLVHADDRAAFDERVRAVKSGITESLECRTLGADRSSRWVEATFTNLLADAAVGGIVVHLRDVTERRRLEGELRQAQKLESVGQLSAGIAHEMNSPIQFVGDNIRFVSQAFTDLASVVAAYAGASEPLAAEQLAVELDTEYLLEEVPKAIAQTLAGIDRMAIIVRAMKAFGDPRGDTKSWFDLNEAVRNTLVVADSELRYVANVVADLGELPLVWCNLGDINQVVLNLVVNAAHAVGDAVTPGRERGTITLRTLCEGADIVLQVQDTGIGIPPEIADRVFEQFFTARGVGRGAGQGLAVAYSLIHDRHDGSITFASEPGVGTTFTVRLPRRAFEETPSQAEELAA